MRLKITMLLFGIFVAVSISAQNTCSTAIDYGTPNGVGKVGSMTAYEKYWYTFTLDEKANVLISALLTPNDLYAVLYLELYDACGEESLNFGYSKILAENLPAGTYYVKVSGYTGAGSVNYTFTASSLILNNNTCATAIAYGTPNGTEMEGKIGAYESYWHTITLDEAADVLISTAIPEKRISYLRLEFYNACDGTYLQYGLSSMLVEDLPIGTYYVKVSEDLGNSSDYVFSATKQKGNTCSTAIDYGDLDSTEKSGTLDYSGSYWYKFTLDEPEDVLISVVGFDGYWYYHDFYLELYDTCGGNYLQKTSSRMLTEGLSAGTYYVKIKNPYTTVAFDYQFAIKKLNSNTCSTAIDYGLPDGTKKSGTITVYETRWYTFTLDEVSDVLISADSEDSNSSFRIDLFDDCSGNHLRGFYSANTIEDLPAGTYYAKIFDSNSYFYENNKTDYVFTVKKLNTNICSTAIDYGLPTGSEKTATINANETCWYKFTLEEESDVLISATLFPDNYDIPLRLYKSCEDDYLQYGYSKMVSENLPAGTYYVKILNGYSEVDSRTYVFTVKKLNNNSCSTAIDYGLPDGTSKAGTLNAYETHWYTFTLDEASDVSISTVYEGLYFLEINLYNDCSGDPLNRFYSSNTIENLLAGTYYVKIFDSYLDEKNYVLAIKQLSLNSCSTAIDCGLPDGSEKTGEINLNESCWYKFTLEEDADVLISAVSSADSYSDKLTLFLYDDCGRNYSQYDYSKMLAENLSAGTYYVKLANSYSYETNPKSYVFTVEKLNSNTCSTAIDYGLPTGSEKTGTKSVYETHWYKFTLDEESDVIISAKSDPGIHLYLYNACGNDYIASDYLDIVAESLSTGTYYVKLANSYYYENNDADYVFTVKKLNKNTCSTAIDYGLPSGSEKTGTMNVYEKIWYKFTLDKESDVLVSTAIAGQSYSDFRLELYNDCGSDYIKSDYSKLVAETLPAGTYYVKVSNSYETNPKDYVFTVERLNSNTCSTAIDYGLPTGSEKTGTKNVYEIHWYKFTLEEESDVLISAKSYSELRLELYNNCGNDYIQSAYSEILAEALPAGTYYVKIFDSYNTNKKNYVFTVKNINNNSCSTAIDYGLPDGSEKTGKLSANERTWYTFTLDEESDVLVSIAIPRLINLDLHLELYNACGGNLMQSDNSSRIFVEALPSGIYYVKLSNSNEIKERDYLFTIKKHNNSTCSTAIDYDLPNGAETAGVVSYYRPEWYRILLTEDSKTSVLVSSFDTFNFDFSLDLYDSCDGHPLMLGNTILNIEGLSGVYYLRIGKRSSSYPLLKNYTLSITQQPLSGITEADENRVVRLYPNPAKDVVYFDAPQPIEKAVLYDINGQVLQQCEQENNMDVSSLQPGVYLMKIITNEGEVVRRFIKN